ncbi:unnamed protein product [Spirodela intermedia]|uniref:Reverse transcriptase/retrotransposon-derived protein RNase H-like domain-containing protein n=2 Tax=Spirodela intermedia TaxID=51605 RepID=A0A7I8JDQ7_SPIIN|nr:unnamed protein product [Spirodela intermedia]CAA6668257.1 unnamed protein product [Spirodela intermedia]CAA7405090.1 unnamed protein product [Spirodela intermedia]
MGNRHIIKGWGNCKNVTLQLQGLTIQNISYLCIMRSSSVPKNVHELRLFLGLTSYYHRFVIRYSLIVAPTIKLLMKEPFCWNQDGQSAFDHLREAMSTTPVLSLPDFSKIFIIEIDASNYGIGAALM